MASPVLRQASTRKVVFGPFVATENLGDERTDVVDEATRIEQARAEAETRGYSDGFRRGLEEGGRLLREQSTRLGALVDRAAHDVEAAVLALEPELVELAMIVAGRVVERELTERPEGVVDVVREALSAAGSVRLLRVRVHPDDLGLLRQVWDGVMPAGMTVELAPDAHIQRGGAIVDTASGFVDAQPSARLEEIRHQIVSRLGATT